MSKWRETPEDRRAYAMRLDPETGAWSKCWYKDLRKGDIWRAFAFDGTQMDPAEGVEVDDENLVAICTADPVKISMDHYPEGVPIGIENADHGWAVECITGMLPDLLRKVAS